MHILLMGNNFRQNHTLSLLAGMVTSGRSYLAARPQVLDLFGLRLATLIIPAI